MLRQLELPCATRPAARFQAEEIRFHTGACPGCWPRGSRLELPARHVVFLHALVEERPVRHEWVARSAARGGVQHHHFPLRHTVEDVLFQAG